MKEQHFFYAPDAATSNQLPAEEAMHALRVLRMKEGDGIFLMDGKGRFYDAVISLIASKKCFFDIKETIPQEKTWNASLHLAIAPTKSIDRIEWMVEKSVEVGIDEITFLNTKFSERSTVKTERIEKIVVSAAKQSRKAFMPKVNPMIGFNDFVSLHHPGRKFISHCYNEVPRIDFFDKIYAAPADDILVLVGPEGDFSLDEVRLAMRNGYISTSLGSQRLRTETAALSAVMIMQLSQRL